MRSGATQGPSCRLSLDWLECSTKRAGARRLIEAMGEVLGPGFGPDALVTDRDDEARFVAKGPHGVRVLADRIGALNRVGAREPWAGVRLPGAACQAAGTPKLLAFLRRLGAPGRWVKVSRVDLALDDFGRRFSPKQFATACVAGRLDDEGAGLAAGVVTRVRRDNWDWSRRKGGCFWLGGASAGRRLRVYDKERESGGAIASVRVELQSRDEYAAAVVAGVLEAEAAGEVLAARFVRWLVAFVDLRQPRGGRTQTANWPRVEWWREFVGDATAAGIAGEDPSAALEWERQCAKQCRGFVNVQLRLAGVTPEEFAQAVAAARGKPGVVAALARILGAAGLVDLGPEHAERLRQLREAREAGLC